MTTRSTTRESERPGRSRGLDDPADSADQAPAIVVIGAGPRGVGVLERLAANLDELWGRHPLLIHLVDPHPAGPGRIWRVDQSPLLKMNSMARDITMFTDASSTIDGPVREGPSLIGWVESVRGGRIAHPADPSLRAEIATLTGDSFATRRLHSLYLAWFAREARAALGPDVTVREHRSQALRVDDRADGRQTVFLDTGRTITADLVLYSVGHLGADPEPEQARLVDFARRRELYYLPPAFTADADTRPIVPGQRVIVRGLGLAAVDLTVLLTEGRGGAFVRSESGELSYRASGLEPRILLGSRRGVPYHSKIGSRLVGERPEPRFFTPAVAAALEASGTELDFSADVWPLIAKEMLWGYYRELFTGHPDRVSESWASFAERFEPLSGAALIAAARRPGDDDVPDAIAYRELVTNAIPDAAERLFLPDFDRPLSGRRFDSTAELQSAVREYIRTDLRLRTSAEHSATLGLFIALLTSLFTLSDIIDSPLWSARTRVTDIHGWWPAYFSYVASGPPGHRLEELLALSEAGIVEFLGAGIRVEADEENGVFTARGENVDHAVSASALVDARLPAMNVARSDSELLRSLLASGGGLEEIVADDVFIASTGRLTVRKEDTRLLNPSGSHSDRRYAIGPYTNSPFVGSFSRPGTNAVSFRENDKVARALLRHLAALTRTPRARPSARTGTLDRN